MVKIVCSKCQKDHPGDSINCPNPDPDNRTTILDFSLEDWMEKGVLNSALKIKVFELLQCPIDWAAIFPDQVIAFSLENYWIEVAEECLETMSADYPDPAGDVVGVFDIDLDYGTVEELIEKVFISGLAKYLGPAGFILAEDDELEKELPYIEEWVKRTRAEYSDRTRRLAKLKMLTTREQEKHFLIYNLSTDQIRKKTLKGLESSLFYRGITPDVLEPLLWSGLEEIWRLLLDVQYADLYIDAIKIIGASLGKDTSLIRFRLDLNTPSAHAHPFPEGKVPKGHKIDVRDDLQ